MPSPASPRFCMFAGCCLALAAAAAGWSSCRAVETVRGPGDYLVSIMGPGDDLPSSTVTAIAQTPDGYLWVGTYEGLARFDGVRFVTFDPSSKPELTQTRVQGLYVDARGTLWINTYRGGLTSYSNGVFRTEWPDQQWFDFRITMVSSTSNDVTFVTQFGQVLRRSFAGGDTNWQVFTPPRNSRPTWPCVDPDGTIWSVTRDGHILRLVKGSFEMLPNDGGLAPRHVGTIETDAQGRVWAGAQGEIGLWDHDHFVDMTPTNSDTPEPIAPTMIFPTSKGTLWVLANDRFREAKDRRWIREASEWRGAGLLGWASGRAMGFHEDTDGGIWINHYGNGVFHVTPDGEFQRFTTTNGLSGNRVGAWFQGRDGRIWLGADNGGLMRLHERQFQMIGIDQGMPVRTALSLCEDRNGTMWIGTTGGGLCSWKAGKMTSYPIGHTASSNWVFSIFPQNNGGLWLSAGDGEDLLQFRDGQVHRGPWDVHGTKALLADHHGRLWVGTKSSIGWYTPTGHHSFGTNEGVAGSAVRALVEAPDGVVWAGADDGALYRCETNGIESFRPDDEMGSRPHPIVSLLAETNGAIWAGTSRGGLLRFKDGEFKRLAAEQGLPMNAIGQILQDDQGRFWLGTHQGICCVSKADLEACADGKKEAVDVITYLDGSSALECSDEYAPGCWRAADGRLWFATLQGVACVEPEKVTTGSLPPSVVIEELRVDGESVPLNEGKIVVPPGHKQFEFQFTALSFNAPGRSRFRYRLEGLDNNWLDADTRRTVHFVNLAPNTYRFHLIACNSDGVWNKVGASVEFTVRPYFYQTRTFLILMSALVLGGVAASVRAIATRKYRRELARLAQQHAIERDRARIAKDIHDDMGAGLTQITLLCELARREPVQANSQLDRISDAARNLTRAMDEIVWAVDPQHDTLIGLVDYISAFAEDFLQTAGIRFRMDLPTALPAMRVDAELRYNLFLALKETLNNIVKHARATEVWLRLRLDSRSLTLIVEDNGRGLKPVNGEVSAGSVDRLRSGSGLQNLQNRLATIGGRCAVQSEPGRGTRVEMEVVTTNGHASPVVAIGSNATHE